MRLYFILNNFDPKDGEQWKALLRFIQLSGGDLQPVLLLPSFATSSSGFEARDNREATPVEVQKGGECGA